METRVQQLLTDLVGPKPSTLEHSYWFELIPELEHLVGLEQNRKYHHHDVWTHTLLVTDAIKPQPLFRLTALLHDVAKGTAGVRVRNKYGEFSDYRHDLVGAKMARKILQRLQIDPAMTRRIVWLIRHHLQFPPPAPKSVKKWLKRIYEQSDGWNSSDEFAEAVEQLLELRRADRIGGHIDPDLEEWQAIVNLAGELLPDVILI